ncbi:hypothetical protein CANINC_002430 [Pichia inconspicua]|uniref:Uncharacterized protein n=1 Tax=Pichia inconspicua TaxID=52247 RepID=A0A4T0X173_9ASCO|nr:hypothetical protein CANINC_002430 [[Candida] inconspicua]
MNEELVPTQNDEILFPLLKTILSKSKAVHTLRLDNNQIKLKTDKSLSGVIYLEAPYILLPNWDRLELIKRGKCCSYCGEVLKLYDNGKMKDDGKKATRQKQSIVDKHERYVNGLDCFNCEGKWCDKQCKGLDFRHELLYHRPTNKTNSHNFTNINKEDVDLFYHNNWRTLENTLTTKGQELCYMTIMMILHTYYDPKIKNGIDALRFLKSSNEEDYIRFLGFDANDTNNSFLKNTCEQFNNCFKTFKISYLDFLKNMSIFKLNNYNGSIYLLFSGIKRGTAGESNIKIEYFTGEIERDFEEFIIKTNDDNSVTLVKKNIKDETIVKPIYTNRSSGITDRKIIQLMSTCRISSDTELVLPDVDYSNPIDLEDDEISFIPSDSSSQTPAIILPVSNGTDRRRRSSRIRNASFTSSGASFGEGIIKYNRDQIREMLENMTDTLNEEFSDESSESALDDVPSCPISSKTNSDFITVVKNLQHDGHIHHRRKSVKFEETVTTI